jgi:hypothetical protein
LVQVALEVQIQIHIQLMLVPKDQILFGIVLHLLVVVLVALIHKVDAGQVALVVGLVLIQAHLIELAEQVIHLL